MAHQSAMDTGADDRHIKWASVEGMRGFCLSSLVFRICSIRRRTCPFFIGALQAQAQLAANKAKRALPGTIVKDLDCGLAQYL